jgi:hypothetical protein
MSESIAAAWPLSVDLPLYRIVQGGQAVRNDNHEYQNPLPLLGRFRSICHRKESSKAAKQCEMSVPESADESCTVI